ncbi:hypothetical protein HYH03_011829 [Edaphochlamys debaryana]|uniref:Pherophorin domain-containing protein n=1 Tax=Edaphochlamys debaryana TaxID=47281 RepID=A0A835XRB3_9CHLO|nr:hypothetical protein HYH03_011829 [Edaphochlamys debaryana]|eukprot:KAG2489722.1 hypothetical protein HYH03_011829 [Edaphochlamys debaryana]
MLEISPVHKTSKTLDGAGKKCRKDPSLRASLVLRDGTSRPVSHSIQRGGPGSAGRVLVLRGLGLNRTSAGSARLCISSQRPACRTAEGLCQPPTGSAPGTCRAELRDSAGGCCSESAVEAGKDRSPARAKPARAKPARPGRRRPPPSPSPPRQPSAAPTRPLPLRPGAPLLLPQPSLPPLGLPTCVEASMFDTTAGAGGSGPAPSRYSLSAAACASAQALIAGQLNTAAAGQLAAPFAAAGCSDTQVRVCGSLAASGADTSALQDDVYTQLDGCLDAVFPEGNCRDGTYGIAAGLSISGGVLQGRTGRLSPPSASTATTASAASPAAAAAAIPTATALSTPSATFTSAAAYTSSTAPKPARDPCIPAGCADRRLVDLWRVRPSRSLVRRFPPPPPPNPPPPARPPPAPARCQLCFLLQFVGAGTPGAKGLCDALARAARDLLKPLADAQGLVLGAGQGPVAWTQLGCGATDSPNIAAVSVCTELPAAEGPLLPRVLPSALRAVFNALFPPTPASTAGGCAGYPAQAASYRLRANDGVNAGGGGCFSPSDFSCLSGSSTPPSPLVKPGFRAPAFLDSAFPPDAACAKDASGGPFRLQPSACSGTRVTQLAFQARADRRADLLSVIVRGPADQRRLPAPGDAWWALPGAAGAIGSRSIGDALWVRPVDWTVDTVRELSGRGRAQVCLELRSGVALGDFCVGGTGGCSVAIYSSDTCCPVGAAGAAAA